jgi:hypothetical protein
MKFVVFFKIRFVKKSTALGLKVREKELSLPLLILPQKDPINLMMLIRMKGKFFSKQLYPFLSNHSYRSQRDAPG